MAHCRPWLSPSISVPLVMLCTVTGCASKGDLEALRQELKSSVSQVELLKGETRKELEERARQISQDLKAVQAEQAKLSEILKAQQANLAEVTTSNEALAKEYKDLHSSVQSTSRILFEYLKSEEAQLKEGLRWIQSVLQELGVQEKPKEPLPAK